MPLVGAGVAVRLTPGIDIGGADCAHDRIKGGIVADGNHAADSVLYGGFLQLSVLYALIGGAHGVELNQACRIYAAVVDREGFVGVQILYINGPGTAAGFDGGFQLLLQIGKRRLFAGHIGACGIYVALSNPGAPCHHTVFVKVVFFAVDFCPAGRSRSGGRREVVRLLVFRIPACLHNAGRRKKIAFSFDGLPARGDPSAGICVIFFAAVCADAAFLQDSLIRKDIAFAGDDGDTGGGGAVFGEIILFAADGFPAVFNDFSFGIVVINFSVNGA